MTDANDQHVPAGGRLGSFLTAVRMRTSIHRYAMRVLDSLGHAPLMDPGSHVGVRTTAAGRDPIRVLVLGAGLAVGYGVRTRDDAFDGPLTHAVAALTGRGVVLENRAVQHLGVAHAVESLGPTGTHTFHVAVWCPSFAEGMERTRLSGWRSELHAMVRSLRAESPIDVVLTCMPVPAGLHPAALVARPWVHRLNRVITQVADEWDDVVAVETSRSSRPRSARRSPTPPTSPPSPSGSHRPSPVASPRHRPARSARGTTALRTR